MVDTSFTAPTPSSPERLVIVGGVAGGMSCAARARRLNEDAHIVVLDRGDHVSFANCGLPYYVGAEIAHVDDLLVQTPDSLRASLNLDVRPNHDVVALDPHTKTLTVDTAHGQISLPYDKLVLAPGARSARPPIPGLDSPRVHTLRTVGDAQALRTLADEGLTKAVVLGAGFIGVEAAEVLVKRGVSTTVIEFADHILPPLDNEPAWFITQELTRLGVDVRTGVRANAIQHADDQDIVELSDGTSVAAQTIILATGVQPDTSVFQAGGVQCERGAIVVDEYGRTSVPDVWAVGDATLSADAVTGQNRVVALAGPANRAGRLVADAIFRPQHARPIPDPTGTAIIRVGDLTAAMTGANQASLQAAGRDYQTLHLHPNQHAGYFPGASQVHLSVHIDPHSGQILGAQAVGRDGVDKRIDVLATALRAQLTVADLIDLDLAYAPPFGQAKDPINLVGMFGANVVDGAMRIWDARDLDQIRASSLILDVRSAGEVASGMLRGALNIPHTQLRSRIDEVKQAAAGRPVAVLCASGVRSAIAHRILVQHGFDSASLSGGMLTLRAVLADRVNSELEIAA